MSAVVGTSPEAVRAGGPTARELSAPVVATYQTARRELLDEWAQRHPDAGPLARSTVRQLVELTAAAFACGRWGLPVQYADKIIDLAPAAEEGP